MTKNSAPDRDIEPTHGGGRRDAEKKGSDDAEVKKHLNVRELPMDQKEDAREGKGNNE